jgi:hypothetical protein
LHFVRLSEQGIEIAGTKIADEARKHVYYHR